MNPYKEMAEAARRRADELNKPSAHEAAMAHAFPLGAGFGRKGGEKRLQQRIDRATKAIEAARLADTLEAKAAAWERGEITETGRRLRPKLPPKPKKAIPDDERLFIGDLGGGVFYCDRAIEKNGDFKKLAFLPRNGCLYGALEWRAKRVPPFLRAAIEAHAAAQIAKGKERAEEEARLLELEREWKKANMR